MHIQWFPGHMNRAKRAVAELVEDIDIVIELLDARAPLSSCNPLIQNIIKFKRKIRILNKSDLSDPELNKIWLEYFTKQENTTAILGDKDNKKQRERIIKICQDLAPARGTSFEKPLRVMITGIPNVGKSTLINQLTGKKSAKTGDVPAVTKANQRLYINDTFIIYDTPGMMWQKIRYPQIGYNLALCNSIGRNALDEELLALYLIEFVLASEYRDNFVTRYKLKPEHLTQNPDNLLNTLANKRGCIMTGGVIDRQKISEIVIQDFRDGKFGKISLETPDMWQEWITSAIADEEQSLDEDEKLVRSEYEYNEEEQKAPKPYNPNWKKK
ncbi:MAG: ribosome biogenesis GTPase YlqF [Neisseriaceae bacterium]|nr:MAG: ribosome biogenesis GTPase YlqF [Neisseriaceae bacterium]